MKFRVLVENIDVTNVALVENCEITRRAHEAISTARVRFQQRLAAGDKFFAREWKEWDFIEIQEAAAPNAPHFRGWITEIRREAQSNEKFAVDVGAVDLAIRLDRKVSASVFSDTTDRAIAKALANEAGAGIVLADANIDFTATLASFDARDMVIREAFERLCEITGCRWHLDPLNALHYYEPGNRFAPFNLSDTPDGTLWFPYQMRDFTREFSSGANRITLLGGIGESGTEIKVTLEDPGSVSEYGALEAVTIDRQITATAVANLKVQSDLAQRALPRISGRALVRYPSVEFWRLQLGQMIGIKSALYDVDSAFVIHGIREFIDVKTNVAVEVEFGAREADIVSTFRMLMRDDPDLPQATIGPGTVIPAENIVGTIGVPGQNVAIAAETVTGTLSGTNVIVAAESLRGTITGTNVAVDAATIEGLISGDDVQVSGQTITGAITGEDVTIQATAISGVIVSDQLADQILDTVRLVGPQMGVIERIPASQALPALPNIEYPLGSTVLQSAIYGVSKYGEARYGSVLYKNVADAWTLTSASGEITGIMKAGDIESITAQQITGLIIAAQIQNIRAEQITGIIQGDQIGTINASSITSVNASAITGSISAANITSLNAGNITMITKWDETRIQSVNASSITAGTISATVVMTSPDIRVTGSGYNLVLNNAVGFKVTATGTTRSIGLTDSIMRIDGSAGNYTQFYEGHLDLFNSSGRSVILDASGSSSTIQVTSYTASGKSILINADAGITISGAGNYISSPKYLMTDTIGGPFTMPANFSRYLEAYALNGVLVGKIPIIP